MSDLKPAPGPRSRPALWPADYHPIPVVLVPLRELPDPAPYIVPVEAAADLLESVLPGKYTDFHFRADADTSVHPPETNPPDSERVNDWGYRLTSNDAPVLFRHSGWARARTQIRQAFVQLAIPPRALQRFDLCGSDPWVVVDKNDESRLAVHSNHCHSRWCVPCSRDRAARIVGNLKTPLANGNIRFLTLTLKHSDKPLASQLDRLYAAFRRLRRADFWQQCVDGGAAVLEIGHGHADDRWHVHLHCLLQGRYVPHALIKAEWFRITGDSNIVDIRPVYSADHAAKYVTKYVTKPLATTIINKPGPLLELISACGRRRLVLTWGCWRGIRLSAPLDPTSWQPLVPLDELYQRREDGDADANALLNALEHILPAARAMAGRDPPS